MKRKAFLKILEEKGVVFFRHGAGHDIYIHTKTDKKIAVPRHSEIENKTIMIILRELDKNT